MKAVVLTRYGSPDFFEFTEVKKPTPGENEVLLKVFAASVNSWDWEILIAKPFVNRLMAGLFKPKRIKILGCDVAGRVEAVGKKVTQFLPGDEVFGDLSRSGWGGFAEYVCARENALISKSKSMTFEQAAAIPQAGLLALQALRFKGDVQSGNKILFNGAGGGVGTLGIQMAKLFGAEVTGVDLTEKLDKLRLLGADHVIDYRQEDFTKNGLHYNRIVDVAGYRSIFEYKRSLIPGGIFVMVGGSGRLINQLLFLWPWFSMFENKKMGLLMHKPNKGLAFMKELFETGKVFPVIDRCFPLSEVADAFRYYSEGQVQGKIIITMHE